MASGSQDRSDQDPGAGAGAGASDDPLRRLEERLNRASDAAERLIVEAAEAAAAVAGGKPPPAGWQSPSEDDAVQREGDVELLVRVLHSLRGLIPPELQRRLAEALREVLLAVRALIDWYLERAEDRRAEPAQVEDIPIV